MVQRSNRRSKQTGFTLVELLIVVAIIGVLSTIGVPTFKRMIQKSKKSEAKVNLGGLYTAEQAFFAEKGFASAPKRCSACRAQRRASGGGGTGAGASSYGDSGGYPSYASAAAILLFAIVLTITCINLLVSKKHVHYV